jgi:hypothetical protein
MDRRAAEALALEVRMLARSQGLGIEEIRFAGESATDGGPRRPRRRRVSEARPLGDEPRAQRAGPPRTGVKVTPPTE